MLVFHVVDIDRIDGANYSGPVNVSGGGGVVVFHGEGRLGEGRWCFMWWMSVALMVLIILLQPM